MIDVWCIPWFITSVLLFGFSDSAFCIIVIRYKKEKDDIRDFHANCKNILYGCMKRLCT